MLVFVEGGKSENSERKTLGARREPTKNSTHIGHWAGINAGSHWWEACTLTTAPFLLPQYLPLINYAKLSSADLARGLQARIKLCQGAAFCACGK